MPSVPASASAERPARAGRRSGVLDARGVSQRFGRKLALRDVSLDRPRRRDPRAARAQRRRQDDAHPDPGGAPAPDGRLGRDRRLPSRRRTRACSASSIGFVASGDRTFYLRISGLENLVFFARLHGMTRRQAIRRAEDVLADVGLADAARKPRGRVLARHAEAPRGRARAAHLAPGPADRRGDARPRSRGGAARPRARRRRRLARAPPSPG